MNIEPKRTGETLHEGHGAGSRVAIAEATSFFALPGEDDPQKDREHARSHVGVEGQA